DCRPRRRAWRQLRADQTGRNRGRAWRDHYWSGQCAVHRGAPRQPDVRQEHGKPAQPADRQGRQAEPGFRGRDRSRNRGCPRRRRTACAYASIAQSARTGGPVERRSAGILRRLTMDFIAMLALFVLAIFLGVELITKVPPTLHTPLMSGSNAISGITLVGAILAAGQEGTMIQVFGFIAVVLATINVIGGFMVTNRMLAMFKRK